MESVSIESDRQFEKWGHGVCVNRIIHNTPRESYLLVENRDFIYLIFEGGRWATYPRCLGDVMRSVCVQGVCVCVFMYSICASGGVAAPHWTEAACALDLSSRRTAANDPNWHLPPNLIFISLRSLSVRAWHVQNILPSSHAFTFFSYISWIIIDIKGNMNTTNLVVFMTEGCPGDT